MPKHEWVLFKGRNGDVMISYPKMDKYGSLIPTPEKSWEEPGLRMLGIGVEGKRRYILAEAWHVDRLTDPKGAEPTFEAYAECSNAYEKRCAVLEIKLWP